MHHGVVLQQSIIRTPIVRAFLPSFNSLSPALCLHSHPSFLPFHTLQYLPSPFVKTLKMASSSKAFRSCRALFQAVKAGTTPVPTPSPAPAAAAKKKTVVSKPTAKKPARKFPSFVRPPGIFKQFPVSPALGSFLGVNETSRSEAVKKIWDHIKLHNLQNPTNRKEIVCDDKLKKIFEGKETVGFLEISGLLNPHFVKN